MVEQVDSSQQRDRDPTTEQYKKLVADADWVEANRGKFAAIGPEGVIKISTDLHQLITDVKTLGLDGSKIFATQIGKKRGRMPIRGRYPH